MTTLRRVAQVVEDLRTLGVINEADKVEYVYTGQGGQYKLSIKIKSINYRFCAAGRYEVVQKAFEDEFRVSEMYVSENKYLEGCLCGITICFR